MFVILKICPQRAEGVLAENQQLSGMLFILIGPGGVGKNATMNEALKRLPLLRQMPTATTRPIREGEVEGRQHFFVTLERFQQMIDDHLFIEYVEVHPGKWYGTPHEPLQAALAAGEKLIADIDVLGARKIKLAFPENVKLIFIEPPSIGDLEKRLTLRGLISDSDIADRLERAQFEISQADEADYRVVNDDLDRCVSEVLGIISGELKLVQQENL